MEQILQLKTYSYKIKHNTVIDSKTTFGFLAQEIHTVLPDITDTAKGIMLIDYQQIIPLLVEALKEQQSVIDKIKNDMSQRQVMRLINTGTDKQNNLDSLMRVINEIKNQITQCCNQKQIQKLETNQNETSYFSTLFQNIPNPFSEKTIIEFEIIERFSNASIMIFDMQGILKKTIPITQNGKGQITINGNELKAGMYLYSLLVDNKEIDTKRMILMYCIFGIINLIQFYKNTPSQ